MGSSFRRDLVQLDLVAERVEYIAAAPSGDGRRVLELRTVRREARAHGIEVVDLEREVPPTMQCQVCLCGEVHLARASFEPETVPVSKRFGSRNLRQAQCRGVESPCFRLFARWIEHLRVMQRN